LVIIINPNNFNIKNLKDKLSMNNLKPLIKWVGGKTQILNDILNKFPSTINN
jgi:hypothetical protein